MEESGEEYCYVVVLGGYIESVSDDTMVYNDYCLYDNTSML